MKFALLLYEDDAEREVKSDEEVSLCLAYAAAMEKAGILVGGERLRPARSAATRAHRATARAACSTDRMPRPRSSSADST